MKAEYQSKIESHEIKEDQKQLAAVELLSQRSNDIMSFCDAKKNKLYFIKKKLLPTQAPLGIYIHGPVGRGKTFLMDLFFNNIQIKKKQRLHFYRFLRQIHGLLSEYKNIENPIDHVASILAKKFDLICLDELIIEDIGDAMILGHLFEALFRHEVILVTTSNAMPDDLYKNGLQRERFIPAINILKKNLNTINLDGEQDYRLLIMKDSESYIYAKDNEEHNFTKLFKSLGKNPISSFNAIELLGRRIDYQMRSEGLVWFKFDDICSGPRNQNDYIEIATRFHTVCISHIPQLDTFHENEARRFMSLIDEFYDRKVNVFLTSDVSLQNLYNGKKLQDVFGRTVSRIEEMQTTEYLSQGHMC
jgi:cell division protein ZapE